MGGTKIYFKKYGKSFRISELRYAQVRPKGIKKAKWSRAKAISKGLKEHYKKKEAPKEIKEVDTIMQQPIGIPYKSDNQYMYLKGYAYGRNRKELERNVARVKDELQTKLDAERITFHVF